MKMRFLVVALVIMQNISAHAWYEVCADPLMYKGFDVQFQGGIAPILWNDRGSISHVNCQGAQQTGPIFLDLDFPKFAQLYRVGWIAGAQVGYSVSGNTRFFIEANYLQSSGKKNPTFNADFDPTILITLNASRYRLFDCFGGVRYYFDRLCDCASFFFGGKVGITHHRSAEFNYSLTSSGEIISFPTPLTFFLSKWGVSGGGHIGIDFCICPQWSVVVTFEVVGSCAPRSNSNIVLPASFEPSTNLIVRGPESEIRFPITAGMRYSF